MRRWDDLPGGGFCVDGIKVNDQNRAGSAYASERAKREATRISRCNTDGQTYATRLSWYRREWMAQPGGASHESYVEAGRTVDGFQLRYLYFIDPTARNG